MAFLLRGIMIKLKEQKIKQLIAESGHSVRSWAKMYNFPQGTLSNWLNGARNIKRSSLERLAEALGVAATEIADFVFIGKSTEEIAASKEEICRIFDLISEQQRFAILNMARFMLPKLNSTHQEETKDCTS